MAIKVWICPECKRKVGVINSGVEKLPLCADCRQRAEQRIWHLTPRGVMAVNKSRFLENGIKVVGAHQVRSSVLFTNQAIAQLRGA